MHLCMSFCPKLFSETGHRTAMKFGGNIESGDGSCKVIGHTEVKLKVAGKLQSGSELPEFQGSQS